MDLRQWRTLLARLFGLGAFACGLVGLIIGIVERQWKLGVTGWFTGGTLLALIAVILILDEYVALRRRQADSRPSGQP